MKKILLSFLFIAVINISYTETKLLKVDLQDTAPKFIKFSDGTFSGLCYDLMQLIAENSEYQFEYSKNFTPRKRILLNLQRNHTDVHFGLLKTAEREKIVNFGEPLYKVRGKLASRMDDNLVVFNMSDVIKLGDDGIVLSMAGVGINDRFRSKGMMIDDSSRFVDQALLRLMDNRLGRFVLYHDLGLFYQLKKEKFKGKFKIQPVIMEEHAQWMIFSKSVQQETIDELAEVINELKHSGEWDEVLGSYGVAR